MSRASLPMPPDGSAGKIDIDEEARRISEQMQDETQREIDAARKRQALRASGNTAYGMEIADGAQNFLDRNATQQDMGRISGLQQGSAESDQDYLMRQGTTPGSRLGQAVSEEQKFRADADFGSRRQGLIAYLQGQRSPDLQRRASEFVQNYPREYRQILAQMRGGGAEQAEPIPFDEELMRRIEQDPTVARPNSREPREMSLERQNRRAQKLADKQIDARGRFITGMSRRYGDNPKALEGAIRRWNERNPDNPVMLEDFDTLETARPGDVVNVNNMNQLRNSNVAPNVIINGPRGLRRTTMKEDGKLTTVAVLQDSATGEYYPDPDAFNTNESFDKALTRQDRVNLRSAVLNSGNSMLTQEQRRLDFARSEAIKSIPEIREAALSQVAEMESELHYRYASSFAKLQGIPSYTGESRQQFMDQPSQSRGREQQAPTMADVPAIMDELRQKADPTKNNNRAEQKRYEGMSEEELRREAIEIAQQRYIDSQTPLFGEPPAGREISYLNDTASTGTDMQPAAQVSLNQFRQEVYDQNRDLFRDLVQPMGQGMGSRDQEVLERMAQLAEFVDGMAYGPQEKAFFYDRAFEEISENIREGGLDPIKYQPIADQIKGRFSR